MYKILKNICFLSIFISSCDRHLSFSADETEKVTGFFEELLLEHGGAYTLFGSKPITIEDLISNEDFEKVRIYLQEHPEIETIQGGIERKFEEGWNIWKTRMKKSSRFILKEIDLNGCHYCVFMNKKAVVETLLKYYDDFKQIVGKDFDPEQEVIAFSKGKTSFWHTLLLDHKAQGILFGYGYANASKFYNECRKSLGPSENNDPRLKAECVLNNKPFRIPIFSIIEENESQKLIKFYKEERERIKSIYQGRDFLTVTIDKLYQN
ncbi:MAG: hypothetical protein K1X28_02865 [Parachlamydiales bacterium]|nr:hypothetical protein [Parachlamydiales bacterium]